MSIFIVFVMLLWSGVGWASSPEMRVTASSYEKANEPGNAIDNDPSTHWTCRGGCWIEIDRGYVGTDVTHFFIAWLNEKRENFFDIAVSVDRVNWMTVFSGSNLSENTGTETGEYEFDPDLTGTEHGMVSARYIRVIGHGNNVSNHNSIAELSIWTFDQNEEEFLEHEVASATASASNKTNTPERAVDGNLATHWTADNGESLQLDLGYVDTVENVKIAWLSGNKRKADFDIEVSVDGISWELAFSGTSTGASLKLENNFFGQEYCARYVRITGLGNDHPTQGNKNSITEVEIWGWSRYFDLSCEEEVGGEIDAVAGRM